MNLLMKLPSDLGLKFESDGAEYKREILEFINKNEAKIIELDRVQSSIFRLCFLKPHERVEPAKFNGVDVVFSHRK